MENYSEVLSPEFAREVLSQLSVSDLFEVGGTLLLIVIFYVILYIVGFWLSLKINKAVFARIEKKRGKSITLQFLKNAVVLGLIVVFIVIPMGGKEIAKSMLGSTAVIAAIVGLAANEVLKDMFAGLEISIYKPFDVGSRIMLNDGRTGIVEKLTLRHVVLQLVDTTRLIIPNSQANTAIITNYSYAEHVPRSLELRFPVSYAADIEEAKKVIRETICSCPLTLNEDRYKENDPNSRSVYFLELKDSSVILGATVYYPHKVRTEVVKDEVNTAIFNALAEHGIEIPYNYVNVVMKKDTEDQ
jgi:small conductance mechanosensitive channel